jgi:hypothetical protein
MRGFVWLVLVVNASSLAAQQRPAVQSADAVVREFFDAIQRGSFIEAARHLDTAYFHDSKRQLLESARVPHPRERTTAEEYMKHDPDMPRAVAEYYAKRSEAAADDFNELEYTYADVPDTMALKLLSARELAARWLEAHDMRYTIRKLLRSKRCPSASRPLARAAGQHVPGDGDSCRLRFRLIASKRNLRRCIPVSLFR